MLKTIYFGLNVKAKNTIIWIGGSQGQEKIHKKLTQYRYTPITKDHVGMNMKKKRIECKKGE